MSQECPICLEVIGATDCCITKCEHNFCLKCLSIALQRDQRCPMCRNQLIPDVKKSDKKKIARLQVENENLNIRIERLYGTIRIIEPDYIKTMMILQDNHMNKHKYKKKLKHKNLIIKLKDVELKENDNWKKKWSIISKISENRIYKQF